MRVKVHFRDGISLESETNSLPEGLWFVVLRPDGRREWYPSTSILKVEEIPEKKVEVRRIEPH